MFQFTGFPSMRYGLAHGYLRSAQVGFPIQTSLDRWIFAPPQGFSQLITSFIGSQCQGIRPVLFLAWPSRYHSVDTRRLCCLVFLLFVAFATPRFVSISTFYVFLDVSYMQFSRYMLPGCFISHQNTQASLYPLITGKPSY